MMQLHETVQRVYNKIFKIFGVQVLGDQGWSDINSLNISHTKNIYIIKTKTKKLVCSPDHILITHD